MSDTLVLLEAVSCSYGDSRHVLRGCSFGVRRSERVGLVGSNGSGKTTLLRMIVGLVRPSAGRLHVFGRIRAKESDFREVRRRAGLLFQDSDDQLFCPTVIEDVAFGPLNLGKSPAEARHLVAQTLERLGLAGFEPQITHRLSGGEKRLVALATVLAMEPELLLLDEPTSGLDGPSTDRVREVLLQLPQTMVIVSHDQRLLDALATRTVQLTDGQLEPTNSQST
jgi:cobalt/nickel transport system ATP-binding protein